MREREEWTLEDRVSAMREGWNVFDAGLDGSRIERVDNPEDMKRDEGLDFLPPYLADDLLAWRRVFRAAVFRSPLHRKALRVIGEEERARIVHAWLDGKLD